MLDTGTEVAFIVYSSVFFFATLMYLIWLISSKDKEVIEDLVVETTGTFLTCLIGVLGVFEIGIVIRGDGAEAFYARYCVYAATYSFQGWLYTQYLRHDVFSQVMTVSFNILNALLTAVACVLENPIARWFILSFGMVFFLFYFYGLIFLRKRRDTYSKILLVMVVLGWLAHYAVFVVGSGIALVDLQVETYLYLVVDAFVKIGIGVYLLDTNDMDKRIKKVRFQI